MSTWTKKWIALAVSIACCLGVASAQETRDAAAVAAYRAGDMREARARWLDVLNAEPRIEGDERARVLYNLGNVAFREEHTAEAVGWFTASLRLRPRDADTWTNLERARRAAQLEPADRGDLGATVRRLLTSFTVAESHWLALLGLAGLAAALGFEALRGGRTGRWFALGGVGFAALMSAPCLHGKWTRLDRPAIVVEESKALVRSEPRNDAAVVGEAALGAEVEMVDALPGWTKIRLSDGEEGWVGERAVFSLLR